MLSTCRHQSCHRLRCAACELCGTRRSSFGSGLVFRLRLAANHPETSRPLAISQHQHQRPANRLTPAISLQNFFRGTSAKLHSLVKESFEPQELSGVGKGRFDGDHLAPCAPSALYQLALPPHSTDLVRQRSMHCH